MKRLCCLVLALSALAGCQTQYHVDENKNMSANDLREGLRQKANEGWELVTITTKADGSAYVVYRKCVLGR
jgi:hypothetical protein